MTVPKDERNRILVLVAAGQVSAEQGARLLDALEIEVARPVPRSNERFLRARITSTGGQSPRKHQTITLPISLLQLCLEVGVQLFPQLEVATFIEILHAIEDGAAGRLLDLHDMEHGERLEIFVA